MTSKKKKKEEPEEETMTIEEQEPQEEQPEPEPEAEEKKTRVKITITDEVLLEALEKAGGTAKSGQLRDNIDKENYPNVSSPKLGTAIRNKALEMAEQDKIRAIHVDGKRTWTFKTKE